MAVNLDNNHTYLLKSKVFCGGCGTRMQSYGDTSKSGKLHSYYKCSKSLICTQKQTVPKGLLETGITASLDTIFSSKENLDLLVNSILTKYNKNLYDITGLRLAEKELNKIHTSITNVFRTVENGFFFDTTNLRIQELEKRKAKLTEYIATEKTKDMQTVIDMLVRKVVVQNDLINVYLKYKF